MVIIQLVLALFVGGSILRWFLREEARIAIVMIGLTKKVFAIIRVKIMSFWFLHGEHLEEQQPCCSLADRKSVV